MNTPDPQATDPRQELVAIRRRVVATETELFDLKQRIAGLEARLAVASPPPPVLAAAVAPPPEPPPLPPLLEPAAAVVAPDPEPARESDWSRLRAALQQFQLWPPSGESNAEVRLGAWWSTRIGALLAVIGVVFFGIYVSLNTPPWVKFAELLAVVAGVGALGLWLERRVPKFGAVIFGGALALLYFSAYAAYAVPAVRVLETPGAAVAAQLMAVAAIFAASLWRRSPVVATMAVVLGYVAGWFSFSCGLGSVAPAMATVLAVGAVGLSWARGWTAPAALAMPLAYAIVARLALFNWAPRAGERLAEGWAWVTALGVIFFLSDWLAVRRFGAVADGRVRAVQSVNSGLAVLVGLAITLHLRAGALTEFYAGAAGWCAVAAWAWRRREEREPMVPVFACKAAGLLALAVINEWSGSVRALVLLTQALVLLVAARESGLKSLRIAAAVVWGAALLFFAGSVAVGNGAPDVGRVVAAVALVFGTALWSGWNERWLGGAGTWHVASGGAVGLVIASVTVAWSGPGWSPALAVGLAAAAAGGAIGRGRVGPFAAAGVGLLAAHLALIGYARGAFPDWQLWSNAAAVVGAALAAAWALQRLSGAKAGDGSAWLPAARGLLATATVVAVQATWFKGLAPAPALAAAVGTAGLLMAGAVRAGGWPLAGLSTLALALGWWGYGPLNLRSVSSATGGWLALAAAGAWVPAGWFAASAARRDSMVSTRWRERTPSLQTALATLVTLIALGCTLDGATRVGATAAVALAMAALAWRPGLTPALTAASVTLVWGAGWVAEFGRTAGGGEIAAAVVLAAVLGVLPVLARRWVGEQAAAWRRWAAWVHPIAAWLVLGALFIRQREPLAPYATMACGGAAIALFLLGLFARERAARLVGLGGLLLCVPRVFVVDIQSTLYRIGAFVVLGVVLLWVGFSYHRFRHFITDDAAPEAPKGDDLL